MGRIIQKNPHCHSWKVQIMFLHNQIVFLLLEDAVMFLLLYLHACKNSVIYRRSQVIHPVHIETPTRMA